MEKWKFAIRSLLFFILFSVVFLITQEFLRDKWTVGEYNPTSKIKGFYTLKEGDADVVICGSSQAYADIAPAVLYRDYGITSYDFCVNEQPLWITYYYVEEAIEKQHPKVIVLDVFTAFLEDYEAEGVNHFSLDDFPFGTRKLRAIRDSVPKDLRYSYVFPMAKYHDTWDELYESKITDSFRTVPDVNKGYSPFVFPASYEQFAKPAVVQQTERVEIPQKSKEWLTKIIELCKENDTGIMLIKTPNGNAERQKLYNSIADYAAEMDVPFLDMNTLIDGQAHVNVVQAEKITRYLGKELLAHYSLLDHRYEPETADTWADTVTSFERALAKNHLIQINNYEDYLSCLQENGYVYCIAFESRGMIAVYNGEELCYSSPNEYDTTGFSSNVNGANIEAKMVQKEDGVYESELLVNGTDYSLKEYGINIAVYDPYTAEMTDMAAFDLETGELLLRK
ncbi:MAG: hypothetical protein K6G07_08085 [Lachnospiraceae bacterium]|nr:hypothetical protein [Lachnospiraceae bacterium]